MSYSMIDIIKSYTLKEVKLNIEGKTDYFGIQVGNNVILNGSILVPDCLIQEVFDETLGKAICYNLVPNNVATTEHRNYSYVNVKSEPIVTSAPKEVEQPKVEKSKSKEKSE